jgi:NAD+ synthase
MTKSNTNCVDHYKETPMKNILEHLAIRPDQVCTEIITFLTEKVAEMDKDGILIGLSGGFDSAVAAYLAMRSAPPDRITLLNLPDRDSKRIHRRHAQLIAENLGIPLKVKRLSPALRATGVYRSLPVGYAPGKRLKRWLVHLGRKSAGLENSDNLLAARLRPKADSLVARGSAYIATKHRMRMVFLYQFAQTHNLMVVGAANKTEYLTGTFIQWGCDHCADVMPIIHLYRSQLQTLAEYLGVPEFIRNKAADPDVLPGVDDKSDLLGSFEIADQILWGVEHHVPEDQLIHAFGEAQVFRIKTLYHRSQPMREVPYRLYEDQT